METTLTYRSIFDRQAQFFRSVLLVAKETQPPPPVDIESLACQLTHFVVLFPLEPCHNVASIWRVLCSKIDRGIQGEMMRKLLHHFHHLVTVTHWMSECKRLVLPLLLLPTLEKTLDSHPHLMEVAPQKLRGDLLLLFASMNPGSPLVTSQPVSNFLPLLHFLPLIDASADALTLAVLEKLVTNVLRPLREQKQEPTPPPSLITSLRDDPSPSKQSEIPRYKRERLLLLDEKLTTPPKKRPRLEQQQQEAIETAGAESMLPIPATIRSATGEPACELKYSASHTSNYQNMARRHDRQETNRLATFEALQQFCAAEREKGRVPRLDITRHNKIFWCALIVSLDAGTQSVTCINMMNGAKGTEGFLAIRCLLCAHTACRIVAQYTRGVAHYSRVESDESEHTTPK